MTERLKISNCRLSPSALLHSAARLKTRANRMHAIEDVSVSARVPLLCHRCALLFLSQPSGSEKVGTLMLPPLDSHAAAGCDASSLRSSCVCVCVSP